LRIVRSQDVDKSFPARYVDELALRIEEEIICVAAGVDLGNHITSLPVIRCEFWRASENDKHALSFLIERHREISVVSHRPIGPLLATVCINDHDAPFIWQVHKYLVRVGLKLKAFWVGVQGKASSLVITPQIDSAYSAATVADKQTVYRRVDADIIRVCTELDPSSRSIIRPIENSY